MPAEITYDPGGIPLDATAKAMLFNLWVSREPRRPGEERSHSVIMLGSGIRAWLFVRIGQGAMSPPVGHFYVYGHGRPRGMLVDDEDDLIAPAELARQIRTHAHYKPRMRVVLVSCRVGMGSFPQDLANLLGTEVIASSDRVFLAFGTIGTVAPSWPPLRQVWSRWLPGRTPKPMPQSFDPVGHVVTGVAG